MQPSRNIIRRAVMPAAAALASCLAALPALAQTDYYNTDARRPVRIEDAYAVERHAFELQLAPLRLERSDDAVYLWEIEPELAWGVLPRTSIEIGIPLRSVDGAAGRVSAAAGINLGILHNLNTETLGLPAFALAAHMLLPVGGLAPQHTFASLRAIATRTFRFARFHVNAETTFGSASAAHPQSHEQSRWMAGLAIDRALPLRATLLIADLYAEKPLDDARSLTWTLEAGARYQLDPRFALDAGIGRRLNGERGWFLTFGAARAFAIRSLIPVPR